MELIIVITILAILATIAFISFQGYTRDSRNTKRESDLNTMVRTVEVKAANGVPMPTFVSGTGSNVQSGSLSLGGNSGVNIAAVDYSAGNINFTALGANETSFRDPLDADYKIGATTLAGGVYQFAASKENEDGTKTALVKGTYKKRDTTNTASGTTVISSNNTDYVITLTTGLGLFKKNDIINAGGTATGKVIAISGDLSRVTVSGSGISSLSGSALKLNAVESDGLIADGSATTAATTAS